MYTKHRAEMYNIVSLYIKIDENSRFFQVFKRVLVKTPGFFQKFPNSRFI